MGYPPFLAAVSSDSTWGITRAERPATLVTTLRELVVLRVQHEYANGNVQSWNRLGNALGIAERDWGGGLSIDLRTASALAIRAFERGAYLVAVEEEVIEDLDLPVEVPAAGCRLNFLRKRYLGSDPT